jgi:hypothetical protein
MYIAIDKLLKYGRPNAAIDCLDKMRHDEQIINVKQCVSALLAALSTNEPTYSMGSYQIVELIKFLQKSSDVNSDDLFQVEWAYLPLLDRYQGASPKLLETRLASDPEFFCEVIRKIYLSENEDDSGSKAEPSDALMAIATNAWRLLHEWQRPPGIQDDGSFDGAQFAHWLLYVKEICSKSGHLDVALATVGEVLVHCPEDSDGLWINRTVAEALNDRDAESMRDGFRTGIFNSRGVYTVDPSGKPELELAEQYLKKGEDVENAGYYRLAVILKEIANSYYRDAERIISEHKQDVDNG